MGSFNFKDVSIAGCGGNNSSDTGNVGTFGNRVKDECVISLKVYDFCRQQDCLDSDMIGPARAAKDGNICGKHYDEGEIIKPPCDAAAVTIEKLRVKKVVVVSKEPNPFRNGYWDIDLKYVFTYRIIFRGVNGEEICTTWAKNVFNKKITLFGSIASDIVLSTDLFCTDGNSADLDADPFVLVESKAMALDAKLFYPSACCCDDGGNDATEVQVTIGLFTIIKLFRLVQLIVESKGFCVPKKCDDTSALNPCEFFENLDFPMDIFAPPQKNEFINGISANIPAEVSNDSDSGCGCNNGNSGNNGCGCGCGCGCK